MTDVVSKLVLQHGVVNIQPRIRAARAIAMAYALGGRLDALLPTSAGPTVADDDARKVRLPACLPVCHLQHLLT